MAGDRGVVGLIGLGQMGGPMARTLRHAGWRVVAWDLAAAAVEAAGRDGIEPAADPAAVAAVAPIVLTSLPGAAAVRSVALGERGLAAAGRGDLLVVDTSTVAPGAAREVAADLALRGIAFLDAPMSGGVAAAGSGQLSVMVGGDVRDLERARPVLAAISKTIVHCGPIGAGQIAKACNQLIVMSTIAAVAEVMVLARASGLDPAVVREALMSGLAASPILDVHGDRMLRRDFAPGGRARYNLKDIDTIRGLGAIRGLDLPVFEAAAEQIGRLIEGWGGELDNSAVVLVVEAAAGLAAEGHEEDD